MTRDRVCLVITSIAPPNDALRDLGASAMANDVEFILIGDQASPRAFAVPGSDFYSLERQHELDLQTARVSPVGHYARKNIGYLIAMHRGANAIVETDDDSMPYEEFWRPRTRARTARLVERPGWVNVYKYFSDARIWPRGLPLDEIAVASAPNDHLEICDVSSPIHQGLVNDDPDVDAVYRMVLDLPFRFDQRDSVALSPGAWCPFNSQNTTWWIEAFALMYLPAFCSFRMTDIWRSFVAQRIAWTNGWPIIFHAPTISQARNPHALMKDFREEIDGYLTNREMCHALAQIDMHAGTAQIAGNMRLAYELFVEKGWLPAQELLLLDAWLDDVRSAPASQRTADVTSVGR